jgi:cytochrome c nitrite reductase small subunit
MEGFAMINCHRGKADFYRIFVLLIVSLFSIPLLSFGSSKSAEGTDRSEYCISCHVMEAEYEAWMHSGAHRRKDCVDCHLPNENKFVHYLWKSIDGLKDLIVFHS